MASERREGIVLIDCDLVIDATFCYLSAKSLNIAAQVCTSWLRAAKRQSKKRNWCECGLLRFKKDDEDLGTEWDGLTRSELSQLFFHEVRQAPKLVLMLCSTNSGYHGKLVYCLVYNRCTVLNFNLNFS